MQLLLQGGQVYRDGVFSRQDVLIDNGIVRAIAPAIEAQAGFRVFQLQGLAVFPGFADVHVHFREPGFSYKETIATGSRAAAHGGYTAVCTMPNLNPAPDTKEHVAMQQQLIDAGSVIRVLPYGCITMGQKGEGELVDFEALSPMVCGFSDDGRGVKDETTMREAMQRCHAVDGIIAAHCEDMSYIPKGAPIHAGAYAAAHGYAGIPSESEWKMIERDAQLALETGCRYHVCHVSCKESVDIIRRYKRLGADITCETGPHYLLLTDDDLQEDGRFKMNPPLREKADRDALIEGLLDGTIDILATDHAPHSAQEKAKGLSGSAMGIVGIETAFPLLYTHLVETGRVPLERILHCLTDAPRERFQLGGGLHIGERAEITVFDLHANETIDPDRFLSMGRATPFTGWNVHAACVLTICGGVAQPIAYCKNEE